MHPAFGPAHGDGPVYAVGPGTEGVLRYAAAQGGGPWFVQKVLFVVRPEYRGPVLIRGRQLDGPHEVRSEEGIGPAAELLLPEVNGPRGDGPPPPGGANASGWDNSPRFVRVRAPGCYAWQADGLDFSAAIVFEAVHCCPPPGARSRTPAMVGGE